jgi:hypothetical protein
MTELDDGYVEDAPQVYDGPPIPVHITSGSLKGGEFTERLAPDYGSTGTFQLQLAGMAQPVQILQRRYRRSKARVLVMSLAGGTTELTPGNPAAGSNFVYTNTTGIPQVLNSAAFRLTTSAVVANRFSSVQIKDSGGLLVGGAFQGGGGTPASSTLTVLAAQGAGASTFTGTVGNQSVGFPAITIQPGWTVQLLVSGIDVADQLSNIVLTFTQSATTAVFHNRPDILSLPTIPAMTGIQVSTAPYSFDWESQQPLYGVGIGGLVTVSVIDETYADVTT